MRSTVYRFGQVWLVSVSLSQLTVTALQLSVAVTADPSGAGTAEAPPTVRLVGQPLIVGGSRSTTITCWVQLLELPQPSVAVQTTALVPVEKMVGASLITVTWPPLVSEPVAVPITALLTVHRPRSVLVSTSAGQLIVGAVVSPTMMLWLTGAETLPPASVAVQVRVSL